MAAIPGVPHEEVYVPDGCNLHPSCFTCPLPDCEYSDKGRGIAKIRYAKAKARREEAWRLHDESWKNKDIAKHLGVGPNRVRQYLRGD